jgi:hypothetical protein
MKRIDPIILTPVKRPAKAKAETVTLRVSVGREPRRAEEADERHGRGHRQATEEERAHPHQRPRYHSSAQAPSAHGQSATGEAIKASQKIAFRAAKDLKQAI